MTMQTQKYVVSFPVSSTKHLAQRGFYKLAKKHIVKGKRGGARNLSERVDEIVYGV
ncbi:MAG: hypothetical protein Q7S26_04340 [bacterium]|nr:hypothetical protein [bacterium]